MTKQILSTCLAISLIASNTYVSAASTDTTELTDDQSKAVLGGLLLLGVATTLYGQTITRAEEADKQQAAATEAAAKQKATKTLSMKPGHTYVWSSGSADTAPTVTYIESCTPAKQYSATAKLANGVADTNDSRITVKNDSCTIAYDSRHRAVQEYAGNPWSLSASSYKNQQTRIAKAEERSAEATVAIIGGLGKWLFGGGSSSSSTNTTSNGGSIPYVQVDFDTVCMFSSQCIVKNLSISGEPGSYSNSNSRAGAIHRGYNGLAGTYQWSASFGDNKFCSGSFRLSGNKKNYNIRVYDDCKDAGSREY